MVTPNDETVSILFLVRQGLLIVAAGEFAIGHKPPPELVAKYSASRLCYSSKGSMVVRPEL